jgi:hypothetical protein
MKTYQILSFLSVLLLFSCKKGDYNVITNNEPPPDNTVENVYKADYIQRSYLALLGRTPSNTEINTGMALLSKNNANEADRLAFLATLFSQTAYQKWQFSIDNINLMEGSATDQDLIDYLRVEYTQQLADPDYVVYYNELNYQMQQINRLDAVYEDYLSGVAAQSEMHRALVDNDIYYYKNSNIHLLTRIFTYFLLREPTLSEIDVFDIAYGSGGIEVSFLLEKVKTRDEVMKTIFNSTEYYEGQVRTLFLRYLYREPTSLELEKYVKQYKLDKNYMNLQRSIMITDEFLGI